MACAETKLRTLSAGEQQDLLLPLSDLSDSPDLLDLWDRRCRFAELSHGQVSLFHSKLKPAVFGGAFGVLFQKQVLVS